MAGFRQKMPIGLSLSYAFAAVARRDVLLTRMGWEEGKCRMGKNRYMPIYSFMWFEARPVAGEAGLYTILEHHHKRNGWGGYTGDHQHLALQYTKIEPTESTGVYYTRDQALEFLAQLEAKMFSELRAYPVTETPRSFRALSMHRLGVKTAARQQII